MMQIIGTIRNAVQIAKQDNLWKQKKEGLTKREKYRELTAEEQELKRYQEDMARIRESNKKSEISNKLKAGGGLTPEEIAYLKKNDPEALREYEEIKQERETYKRQLRNCKSKEDVEKLKNTKMGEFLSQVKEIDNNPNIPKGKKLGMIEKILKKLKGVEAEHIAFLRTLEYQQLPEEEEEKKKKGQYKEEWKVQAGEIQQNLTDFEKTEEENQEIKTAKKAEEPVLDTEESVENTDMENHETIETNVLVPKESSKGSMDVYI